MKCNIFCVDEIMMNIYSFKHTAVFHIFFLVALLNGVATFWCIIIFSRHLQFYFVTFSRFHTAVVAGKNHILVVSYALALFTFPIFFWRCPFFVSFR